MSNLGDRKQIVEQILKTEYEKKGFLSEDDIIDIFIDHDLDLVEIDGLVDKLLNSKIIVKDTSVANNKENVDTYVDRSHLDYDALLGQIKKEYPNCANLIDRILDILPPQSKEWQTLIVQAQNGNLYARERMILMYIRTVMKQAYYFSKNYYCDFEDAFQNGVIGLMNAIEKYDVTSPDKFSAYFTLWVMQNMQRESILNGSIMRYPVHYKDQLNILIAEASKIVEDDNWEDAVLILEDEFLDKAGISSSEIEKYILPYVKIPDDLEGEDDIENLLDSSLEVILRDKLSKLKEKEKLVIELRYGLIDGQSRTLEEVGSILNVTRERIRQIESKALRRLRALRNINELYLYLK